MKITTPRGLKKAEDAAVEDPTEIAVIAERLAEIRIPKKGTIKRLPISRIANKTKQARRIVIQVRKRIAVVKGDLQRPGRKGMIPVSPRMMAARNLSPAKNQNRVELRLRTGINSLTGDDAGARIETNRNGIAPRKYN